MSDFTDYDDEIETSNDEGETSDDGADEPRKTVVYYWQDSRITSIKIAEPIRRTLAKSHHVVYIYRTIHELFTYNKNSIPVNSNTHIVGVAEDCPDTNLHYVKSHDTMCCERDDDKAVKLDVTDMEKYPLPGDRVSVYGSLHFDDSGPIFVGRFFAINDCDFVEWARTMLLTRTLAPLELLGRVEESDSVLDISLLSQD